MENLSVTIAPKDVVLMFLTALNDEQFENARVCVADDMVFDGVMGHRHGASAYFDDMKKMKFKYNVEKVFEHENDVCIIYNINMQGKAIYCSGLYGIENGKIKTMKVVFDPRPLLERKTSPNEKSF